MVRSLGKIILALAVGAVAVGATWYYSRDESAAATGQRRAPAAPPVEVALASRGPVKKLVTYVATFEPTEWVTIQPKLSGRIEEIPVRLGDFVHKGDIVAIIEDEEFEQQVRQAKANLTLTNAQLKRAEVSLAAAEREFQRTQDATVQGLTTEQDRDVAAVALETAKADVELAKAQIERTQAAYDESVLNLSNTRLVSPMDGYVDKRRVDEGALVTPSTEVCMIVRLDPAKVVLNLPEGDLASAKVGTLADVRPTGRDVTYQAKIERIAPTVELNTRTAQVELSVPNEDGSLRPGMSAEVTLTARNVSDAILVPESALMRGADVLHVQRVINDKIALTPVDVGIVDDGKVEVLAGIEEGDQIVIRGQFLVEDGDTVRAMRSDSPIQAD